MPSNGGNNGSSGNMAFENPVFNRDLYEVNNSELNPGHHSSNSISSISSSDLFLASLEDRRIEVLKIHITYVPCMLKTVFFKLYTVHISFTEFSDRTSVAP